MRSLTGIYALYCPCTAIDRGRQWERMYAVRGCVCAVRGCVCAVWRCVCAVWRCVCVGGESNLHQPHAERGLWWSTWRVITFIDSTLFGDATYQNFVFSPPLNWGTDYGPYITEGSAPPTPSASLPPQHPSTLNAHSETSAVPQVNFPAVLIQRRNSEE